MTSFECPDKAGIIGRYDLRNSGEFSCGRLNEGPIVERVAEQPAVLPAWAGLLLNVSFSSKLELL